MGIIAGITTKFILIINPTFWKSEYVFLFPFSLRLFVNLCALYCSIQDPYTLTFIVILNGTELIPREVAIDIISSQVQHVDLDNYDLMLIGNRFLHLHPSYNNIAINISDFEITPSPTPDPSCKPIHYSVLPFINLNIEILMPSWTLGGFSFDPDAKTNCLNINRPRRFETTWFGR